MKKKVTLEIVIASNDTVQFARDLEIVKKHLMGINSITEEYIYKEEPIEDED